MQQSNSFQDPRLDVTHRVLAAKTQKDLSWKEIAEGSGFSVPYMTAALLGQHTLTKEAAEIVCERLGLGPDDVTQLQAIPLRGSIPGGVPSDPTIYRFYEMIQVYGTTLKALVHEELGDGIISSINFRMNFSTEDDPDGGKRAVITLNGKFLPNKPY